MLFVTEEVSRRIVTRARARTAVEAALIAAARGAASFPAVFGHGARADHRFSIKAGSVPQHRLAGVKIGAYWPSNADKGRPRHNSTIGLIDEETGKIAAVIEAGYANALRTAAANGLAASRLARADAGVLALFGAGHQAFHEVMAIHDARPLTEVVIVNRTPEAAAALADRLRAEDVAARPAEAEAACRAADMIVTATASRAPLFEAGWLRVGTYVASMGSDGPGKQELPVELARSARLVADLPVQAVKLGELQHIAAIEPEVLSRITAIGTILAGEAAGRMDETETFVFDSSGIAMQDLFLGRALLEAALAEGSAIEISSGLRAAPSRTE